MHLLKNCVFSKRVLAVSGILAFSAGHALAGDLVFDELRFGVSASIQSGRIHETGVFPSATLFFDPLDNDHAQGFVRSFLSPRFNVGTIVSSAGQTSQLFGGVDWQINVTPDFFFDAGFGGALNNGHLQVDGTSGPKLGSHLLFHESLAAGVNLDKNWRAMATVEHFSNANLAPPNDGLSYAGLSIGYKF